MKRTDIDEIIANMPAGIDRALLRLLSYHVGKINAISRNGLVMSLQHYNGITMHEREIRALINKLRKDGNLICSTGGKNGGYYLAATFEELDEFCSREMHSRAMDLLEVERALREAASREWGEGLQMELEF